MTSMFRRTFVVAAATLAVSGAWGQSWPDRPVRVVPGEDPAIAFGG